MYASRSGGWESLYKVITGLVSGEGPLLVHRLCFNTLKGKVAFWDLFDKVTNLIQEGFTSWVTRLPETSPLNTITLEIKFRHKFGVKHKH